MHREFTRSTTAAVMFMLAEDTDLRVAQLGSLALTKPVLEQLRLTDILDQYLPHDPQREYTHGHVLATLLAARMDEPTALMNVADWAMRTGVDVLFGVPPDKLNDDRLGRALDAFFDARHTIAAAVAAEAIAWTNTNLTRLHFDPTDVTFFGCYKHSQPRPQTPFATHDADLPPAHLQRGYGSGQRTIQVGLTAIVDRFGALPIAAYCYDGNRNGHTGIAQTLPLLRAQHTLPDGMLFVSDRGTFSAAHVASLYDQHQYALCAVPWDDYRALYESQRATLHWQPASYLSQEQRRRRDQRSPLPHDSYRLAVITHALSVKGRAEPVPCRLIVVHSTAAAREEKERRVQQTAKVRTGFAALAAKLLRGHAQCNHTTIAVQVRRLLGKHGVARFFTWSLPELTPAEQAALPTPNKGHRRATHRLEWSCDEAGLAAAAIDDGVSLLLTTMPASQQSADVLFGTYKEQTYLERMNHQLKTPLAVAPVFLHKPERIEALLHLLHLGLLAQQAAERVYRQRTAADASDRTTAEQLWSAFASCPVVVEACGPYSRLRPVRLTSEQRHILGRLQLPHLRELLHHRHPPNRAC